MHILGLVCGAGRFFAAAGAESEGAVIRGTAASNENLLGAIEGDTVSADVFDANAGGNDYLYGLRGDDIYWLGVGTEHDTIREYLANPLSGDDGDKIMIKKPHAPADVRLLRSGDGDDLIVQLLDDAGKVSDSLTVENYYTDASARVESVAFESDGTVWNLAVRAAAEALGRADKADDLAGLPGVKDTRYGYSGDDTYRLDAGAGLGDAVREYAGNDADGDAGDKILLGSGVGAGDVRLLRSRDGSDLIVQLLDDGKATDSLTVKKHFTNAAAKVESIEFAGSDAVWTANDIAARAIIRGGAGNDTLRGESDADNVFDSDAGGNDTLQGKSGNDTYRLGAGTGRDRIQEYAGNDADGDDGDKIMIKSGIAPANVLLGARMTGEICSFFC